MCRRLVVVVLMMVVLVVLAVLAVVVALMPMLVLPVLVLQSCCLLTYSSAAERALHDALGPREGVEGNPARHWYRRMPEYIGGYQVHIHKDYCCLIP